MEGCQYLQLLNQFKEEDLRKYCTFLREYLYIKSLFIFVGKKERLELINEIQNENHSKVITYVVGDRPNLVFQIGGDTPRLFYDHLLKIGKENKRIDLFLYSIGGDTSVPWRIISLLRESCKELNILVPYKAYSAATLIALGADSIIMGKKGELGPIEPSTANEFNPIDPVSKNKRIQINVEDVYSYLSLIKDKAGIVHQEEIGKAMEVLSSQVHPLALGNVNRQSSYIRMIASRLLSTHKNPPNEGKTNEVIKNLVEKIYFHGHGISRTEARSLGLNVKNASENQEKLMWELYLEYEKELDLTQVFNTQEILESHQVDDYLMSGINGAFIESESFGHVFKVDVNLKANRQMPQNLNVPVNIQLPPGGQADQQFIQQLQLLIQQVVLKQLKAQAPVIGYGINYKHMEWKKENWL